MEKDKGMRANEHDYNDRDHTLYCIFIRLEKIVTNDKRMTLIHFHVQRSRSLACSRL